MCVCVFGLVDDTFDDDPLSLCWGSRSCQRSDRVKDVNVGVCVWKSLELALVDPLQCCLVHRRQLRTRLGEIGVKVLHVAIGVLAVAKGGGGTDVMSGQLDPI